MNSEIVSGAFSKDEIDRNFINHMLDRMMKKEKVMQSDKGISVIKKNGIFCHLDKKQKRSLLVRMMKCRSKAEVVRLVKKETRRPAPRISLGSSWNEVTNEKRPWQKKFKPSTFLLSINS